jgi:hypothetical protein
MTHQQRKASSKGLIVQKTFRSGTHLRRRKNITVHSLSLRVFVVVCELQYSTVRNKCDREIECNEKSDVYICKEKLLQLHFCGAILFKWIHCSRHNGIVS